MHYREHILEDDRVLADSGTETFDIKVKEPITEMLLKFVVKNGTAVASQVEPESIISKIELVDGGQTYLSMTGREAVAVAAYEKGKWPHHWYAEYASGNQRITIPLQFGRYVGDPSYGFDPTRLRNPQLKFTWAKNALHLTGGVSLGIICKVMEGVASPPYCLLTKGVENWTGAASGAHIVDMWNDYPWRRLFIRSYLRGTLLDTLLSHFKLSCDADKLILFDCDAPEFQDIVCDTFGEFELRKFDVFETGALDYKDTLIDGHTVVLGSVGTQYMSSLFWASGANYYSCRVVDYDGAEPATCYLQVKCIGEFPHATYCYQFGDKDVPESWFNAPAFGDIDLKLTEGGLGVNSVLLQQPRSLP